MLELAAVDVADEAPGRVEEPRPPRHREEEVVVLVGVLEPAREPAPEAVVELLTTGLRRHPRSSPSPLLPTSEDGITETAGSYREAALAATAAAGWAAGGAAWVAPQVTIVTALSTTSATRPRTTNGARRGFICHG